MTLGPRRSSRSLPVVDGPPSSRLFAPPGPPCTAPAPARPAKLKEPRRQKYCGTPKAQADFVLAFAIDGFDFSGGFDFSANCHLMQTACLAIFRAQESEMIGRTSEAPDNPR